VGAAAVSPVHLRVYCVSVKLTRIPAVAFIVLAVVVCLARGPRETGWIGWSGGWAIRRDDPAAGKRGSDPEVPAEKAVPADTASSEGSKDNRQKIDM
jgi:hypothetical protein